MHRIFIALLFFVQFISANSLSLVDNQDGTWNVNYSSDKEIRNFSFSVVGTSIKNISHGVTRSKEFWIDAMGSYVNGFSTTGKSISAGQGVMVVLHLLSVPTGLSNIYITDSKLNTHIYEDLSNTMTDMQKKLINTNTRVKNVLGNSQSTTDSIRLDNITEKLDEIESVVLDIDLYQKIKQLKQDSISIRLDDLTKQLDDIESAVRDIDFFQTSKVVERFDHSNQEDTLELQPMLPSSYDKGAVDVPKSIDKIFPDKKTYEEVKQILAGDEAQLIVVGDISKEIDASGNTVMKGEVKNVGAKRADIAIVHFDFLMWGGGYKRLSTPISGETHTFNTGISSDNSILPFSIGNFELIIPQSFGLVIGYKYIVEWGHYD